jgi:hypothetical protein
VKTAAQKVLDVRGAHPDSNLAGLYDPLATPQDLLNAHAALDRAVYRTYAARRRFDTDAKRLQVLFEEYVRLQPQVI